MLKSLLKERLVPAVGACSSLIKMHHQISTGSWVLNEAGSGGTVVVGGSGLPHRTARWGDKALRSGSTWKREGWGLLLRACVMWQQCRDPTHSQPSRCMARPPSTVAPAAVTSRLQRLLEERSMEKRGNGGAKILTVQVYTTAFFFFELR